MYKYIRITPLTFLTLICESKSIDVFNSKHVKAKVLTFLTLICENKSIDVFNSNI